MSESRVLAIGVGVSSGTAEGRIAVVHSVSELSKVQEGDIIVVRESNPAWTVGMMKASALISEYGGVICHAAIIAREMGIPCVVNVANATELFRDGMRIIVNGSNGTIYEG